MPRGKALTPGASPAHHFGSEVLTAPDEAFARACDTAFPEMQGWFWRFWKDSQTWGAAVFPQSLREFAAYEAEAVTL